MRDPRSQVFSAFTSAIRNQSTGVLKIQSGTSLRLCMFSKGSCLDIGSNIKEELPGSFLFQEKSMTDAQYQNYLQKCFAPRTNQWALANSELKLSAVSLLDKRKSHARKIIQNLKLTEINNVQFQAMPNLPQDQAVISHLELFLLLTSKLNSDDIKTIRPELQDISTHVTVLNEPEKNILDDDQAGLFTVIQHNSTIAEILDSSFLDKEKIFQWILTFESLGLIRTESPTEAEKRRFIDSLTEVQQKRRLEIKKELQALNHKNYYDVLNLEKDADLEEISAAFNEEIAKYSSPEIQKIFYAKEENSANLILEKITQAHSILTSTEKRREYDQFIGKGMLENFSDQSQTILEEKLIADINEIIKNRKFDEAFNFLEEKITKYPHFLKLYTIIVDLVRELKIFNNEQLNQRIFNLFKMGVTKSPQESQLFILLGEWCLSLSQQSNALKAFQKALNIKAGLKKIRDYIIQLSPDSGRQLIVEAVYQNLETLNHFEIMGLLPSATDREIRDTYRDVSKHFHPDRFFNTNNQTLKDMAKRVFKEMVASYLVLKDPEKKKAYMEHLFSSQRKKEEKTKATLPKSMQARKYYDQAVMFIEEQNLSSAKLNIQLALSYEPDNFLLQKMLKDIKAKLGSSVV